MNGLIVSFEHYERQGILLRVYRNKEDKLILEAKRADNGNILLEIVLPENYDWETR